MIFLNPLTLTTVIINDELLSAEVRKLLREYNDHNIEVRNILLKRDIAMLKIIEKTELPFNDFIQKVIVPVKPPATPVPSDGASINKGLLS